MEQGSEQGKRAIDQLVGLGQVRVWSVIITIFGDAVVSRGGEVAASTLSALTEQMGVKPEAFRVALSRLTKDGWITRRKRGRLSFYQLSAQGAAEFGPATKRIYATAPGSAEGWKLVLLPSGAAEETPLRGISLGGRAYLVGPEDKTAQGFQVSGGFDVIPDWVRARVGPDDLMQGYAALETVLADLDIANLSDRQSAALRVLVVHQWRRLVLRHADLPERFFPDGWKGEACRAHVLQLLGNLSAASDRWFDNQTS